MFWMDKYTCIHIYLHTYIHTYIHTQYIHIYIHQEMLYIHRYIYIYTYVYMDMFSTGWLERSIFTWCHCPPTATGFGILQLSLGCWSGHEANRWRSKTNRWIGHFIGITRSKPSRIGVAHFDTHPVFVPKVITEPTTGLLSGPTAAEKKLKQLAELLDRSGSLWGQICWVL